MTEFPISVGAQVWAELPYRFRLAVSAGEMPDAYLQTINSIAVAAGAYNQPTANFITELLDHAATWRLHVGWRPFPRRGGYIEGGLGILAVDKGLVLAERHPAGDDLPGAVGERRRFRLRRAHRRRDARRRGGLGVDIRGAVSRYGSRSASPRRSARR